MGHIVIVETTTSGSEMKILEAPLSMNVRVTFIAKSMEVHSYNNKHRILGISDRTIGPLPFFVELGATFPFRVDSSMYQEIEGVISRLFSVLQINQGMIHTELILSKQGPIIVEVNPRLGGGYIGTLISESYEIDIYLQIINLALGKEPIIPDIPQKAASFYILFPDKAGEITDLSGELASIYQYP
ncbi:hypothetical protein C2I18_22895 [Paenibacillus sp. PK3_47]|uniref:ATP-grasp domain-containing protein n=1 Tax=Paenibacillus sp. PK3_47 TaxID=2072642 RepID=UPI00201DB9C3|nr:ATP-grasp domain-containing protein [Paenibacillus sp. PK3_47]UQZ36124.1 hypothetical protein C2I18_22895 [Paenibacillus sp. PK3_47]